MKYWNLLKKNNSKITLNHKPFVQQEILSRQSKKDFPANSSWMNVKNFLISIPSSTGISYYNNDMDQMHLYPVGRYIIYIWFNVLKNNDRYLFYQYHSWDEVHVHVHAAFVSQEKKTERKMLHLTISIITHVRAHRTVHFMMQF